MLCNNKDNYLTISLLQPKSFSQRDKKTKKNCLSLLYLVNYVYVPVQDDDGVVYLSR